MSGCLVPQRAKREKAEHLTLLGHTILKILADYHKFVRGGHYV